MIRAVLDPSVLISALITPKGPSGVLLDAAEHGAFIVCLSPPILAETLDVLTRAPKFRARYQVEAAQAQGFCEGLLQIAELVDDLPDLTGAVVDPKDDAILATALAARAGYLVTGDQKHLLPLGTYEGIEIVSPRAFLDRL